MLTGLPSGEELGAGRALRVEEALANYPGLDAVGLDLGPRDDAPQVGMRGGEPCGAVGHLGGPAEEESVVRVGGMGGGGAWGGEAAERAKGEMEEEAGGCRGGRDGAERRHVFG